MKKWMVVVALLATSQVAAQTVSLTKGMTPFDERWVYTEENLVPNIYITHANNLYTTGHISLETLKKIHHVITTTQQKYSVQESMPKMKKLDLVMQLRDQRRISETELRRRVVQLQ